MLGGGRSPFSGSAPVKGRACALRATNSDLATKQTIMWNPSSAVFIRPPSITIAIEAPIMESMIHRFCAIDVDVCSSNPHGLLIIATFKQASGLPRVVNQ